MMAAKDSAYDEFRQEQQFCDVVIRVDSVGFRAHKIIMCNCSPYFRSLFTHWSLPQHEIFDIPNVSPEMMKLIIDFAYTGNVPVTPENIQELFIAADQFNVKGIIEACCDFLKKQLSLHNCIGIWLFSNIYYCPELKHEAHLFILNHFEEVAAKSEEFLLLSVQELGQIVQDDKVIVSNEIKVFEAILRWITYALEERGEHISLLLPHVRLAFVNPDHGLVKVTDNALVRASQKCQPILTKAMEAIVEVQSGRFLRCNFSDPLTRPRLPPAVLLAVGGWNDEGPVSVIEAYNVRAGCWVSIANYEDTARAYHGTAFLNGSLYCVGGFDSLTYFSSVSKFDFGTKRWQEVAPMHSRRCFVSVAVVNGYMYAIGGFDGQSRLDTAERYCPRTNQWTLIASMIEARSNAGCTSLHGKVYICGGFNGTECLFTCECYNPETNQWTMISSMNDRRSGGGAVAFANCVFIVGGFTGTVRLDTAEVYDPSSDTWRAAPSMLEGRSNFGVAVMEKSLFVIGGFSGLDDSAAAECFNAETEEWHQIRSMNVSRSALSCCVITGLPNLEDYAIPRSPEQHFDGGQEEDEMF